MKYLKFLASLVLLIGIFFVLNTKFGSIPAIGDFLNLYQGIWQNEQKESITGTIQIEWLKDKVTFNYNYQLVPHIFPQNHTDLYKAQGYITAKHKLWQMEFQTHASSGRLSEIIGEKALDYDRMQRRKGMGFGAENALKKMQKEDPEIIAFIEAYSEGVN